MSLPLGDGELRSPRPIDIKNVVLEQHFELPGKALTVVTDLKRKRISEWRRVAAGRPVHAAKCLWKKKIRISIVDSIFCGEKVCNRLILNGQEKWTHHLNSLMIRPMASPDRVYNTRVCRGAKTETASGGIGSPLPRTVPPPPTRISRMHVRGRVRNDPAIAN